MTPWVPCSQRLPPVGVVVETKIHDRHGIRNECRLVLGAGAMLWLLPDGSMYVYFRPTHWRELAAVAER